MSISGFPSRIAFLLGWAVTGVVTPTFQVRASCIESEVSPGFVEVTYIGHAAFSIKSHGGVNILIDPYESRHWLGYDFPTVSFDPDIVLVTHPHYDHDGGEYETGLPAYPPPVRTLRWPGDWDLKDVSIVGVRGRHAPPYGEKFGRANTIWKVTVGGVSFVHFGDNGLLDRTLIELLGVVDVLFLPADGFEHIITHEETSTIIELLEPSVVVPMHYRIDELEQIDSMDDLGNVADWLDERSEKAETLGSTICVSPASLPTEKTIWVMTPFVLVSSAEFD